MTPQVYMAPNGDLEVWECGCLKVWERNPWRTLNEDELLWRRLCDHGYFGKPLGWQREEGLPPEFWGRVRLGEL
jgi:hypothetical protein